MSESHSSEEEPIVVAPVEPLEAVQAAETSKRIAWAVLLLATAYAIQAAAGFVLSIVLAALFALLLAPIVKGLHRIGIPQPLGAAIVMLVLLALMGVLASNLYEPVRKWATVGPRDLVVLEHKFRNLLRPVQSMKNVAEKVTEIASKGESGDETPRQVVVAQSGPTLFARLQEAAVAFVTTVMLVYFLLASGDTFLRKAVRVIPRLRDKITAVEIAREVQQQIGRYFMTIAMVSTVLGVVTGIVMWLLDMPTPLLWGVMAGVLNFILYLGPIISAVVISAVSLFTFDETFRILLPPAVFILLHFIEGHIVEPYVMGGRFAMNPVVIFVWILLWGWLGGAIGVLIAVPLLVAIRICASHIPAFSALAEIIAKD